MSELDYKLSDAGGAFTIQDLVAALDAFAAEGRYSSRRDQILREIKNRPFTADLVFQSTDRTYGYTNDDRFREGQTITATVAGTSHLVSLQMPFAYNDQLRESKPASRIPVTLLINKWNSVSDAFQGHLALDLPVAIQRETDPDPEAPVPPETVEDDTGQEDPEPPESPSGAPPLVEPDAVDPITTEESVAPDVVDLSDNLHVPSPPPPTPSVQSRRR